MGILSRLLTKLKVSPIVDRIESVDTKGRVVIIYSDELDHDQVRALVRGLRDRGVMPAGIVVLPASDRVDVESVQDAIQQLNSVIDQQEKQNGQTTH